MATKINITKARKAYESDQVVYMQSSNMRFNSVWQSAMPVKKSDVESYAFNGNATFDSLVNEFTYYNCDRERGKRVHFYID